VLPTKQPCTVLPAHQCVGELSFAKKGSELCYLPKSISRLRSLRSHVLIIQPRQPAPALYRAPRLAQLDEPHGPLGPCAWKGRL